MSPHRREFLGAVAATAVGGCLGSARAESLTVGVVPDVDPDTAIEQNTALADYLAAELGVSIDLRTSSDYAGIIRAMVSEQVDIAYYGGVSYVLAHRRAGAEPVVVGSSDNETTWHSAFVVPEDSAVESMEDVRERADSLDLVFGDPISTSGTVMPTYYLRTEHELAPQADFERVTHVGAHDATARTISGAERSVGALNARIYDSLADTGDVTGVREIWRTPRFPDYPWAVAPSLGSTTTDDVRTAFLDLDANGEADVLDRQNVDRYVEVTHDDFASLESAVEMAGIDADAGTETGA